MTVTEILNKVLPVCAEHRKCRIKMQKLNYRRDKLKAKIELYLTGVKVDLTELHLSIDIEKLLNNEK